jgi:hypothetical protein
MGVVYRVINYQRVYILQYLTMVYKEGKSEGAQYVIFSSPVYTWSRLD